MRISPSPNCFNIPRRCYLKTQGKTVRVGPNLHTRNMGLHFGAGHRELVPAVSALATGFKSGRKPEILKAKGESAFLSPPLSTVSTIEKA